MLNYIWTGLLVVGLAFALTHDFRDLAGDTYRNGEPFPVEAVGGTPGPVTVRIAGTAYARHFGLEPADAPADVEAAATWATLPADGETAASDTLTFADATALPPLLQTIAAESDEDGVLRARVVGAVGPAADGGVPDDGVRTVSVVFPEVRFVKLRAIGAASITYAEVAVEIALGLIGAIALWLGLVKIAEDAGLVQVFVRVVRPALGLLFPQVPRDHPALGMIALNFAANMLGLGNAATPMGIKAMEQLQTLNPQKDTATNPMCMFLAMNTASVVLVPPATLIAIMGFAAVDVFLPIFAVTALSLCIAIGACALLSQLPIFRASDPGTLPPPSPGAPPAGSAAFDDSASSGDGPRG